MGFDSATPAARTVAQETGTGANDDIVSVIVVGLNACRYVEECLQSLRTADWRGLTPEILYIDNGSSDGTLSMLRGFPEVRLIANPTNLGFCVAANQGARLARGRWLFFLNDDTLVLDDALPKLVEILRDHEDVGIVGARLLNTDLTDQWSGRRFPSLLNGIFARRSAVARWFPRAYPLREYLYQDEVQRGEPFEADWVSAAAMLVEHDSFLALGGFAEDYYYWHEAVFCDRMRRSGRRIVLHPGARIVHHEGKGSGARPFRVRRFHIVNFHTGAFKCYLEHYGRSRLDPRTWLVATGLSLRASLLLLATGVTGRT